jgi:hypothetical protein
VLSVAAADACPFPGQFALHELLDGSSGEW